jgi:glyoxylase-like metal-dependent hydrolase (beta-lactamase superfamily II)
VKVNFRRCGTRGKFSLCGVNVHVLPAGPIPTNAYLLTDPASGKAVLIDAPPGLWPMLGPLLERDGCTLSALWLTHGHWDHTLGAAEVARKASVPILAHRDDRPLLEAPSVMSAFMQPGMVIEPIRVDRWVKDGDTIEVFGQKVAVSHVPGHCPGSLMFHFPAEGMAFPGDALFRGSVGRTDLPGGDSRTLDRSIRTKIYTLPAETVIHPGHGGPTTVGEEKANNPYVRA